jgi:hypothetical protein
VLSVLVDELRRNFHHRILNTCPWKILNFPFLDSWRCIVEASIGRSTGGVSASPLIIHVEGD